MISLMDQILSLLYFVLIVCIFAVCYAHINDELKKHIGNNKEAIPITRDPIHKRRK